MPINKMIINAADPEECRIVLLDDGRLEEYYTDSSLRESTLHNIYKGVVHNVEPSLQAVFVNYGAEKNGFMQVAEIHPEYFHVEPPARGRIDLREAIKKGQEVLVQVTKEATALKGAALTTYISLPGRFLVLMPGREHVGISRKIEDDDERKRLKKIGAELNVPEDCGVIVRTVAATRNKKDITRDLAQLHRLWEDLRKKGIEEKSPCLIYKEQDLAIRTIRDHFNPDIKEVLIDDPEVYERAKEYLKVIAPRTQNVLKLHKENRPIFSATRSRSRPRLYFPTRSSSSPAAPLSSIPPRPWSPLTSTRARAPRKSAWNTLPTEPTWKRPKRSPAS